MKDKFEYKPESHQYFLNDIEIPSVSAILQNAGFNDYSKVPQKGLKQAQVKGTYVHQATALADNDNLDIEVLSPVLKPYYQAWCKFKADYKIEIVLDWIEKPFYSKIWQYGFTIDRLVKVQKSIAIWNYGIVDIKTGSTLLPEIALQLAGYKIGFEEQSKRNASCGNFKSGISNKPIKIKFRWAIQLLDTGDYKVQPYDDNSDEIAFINCVKKYYAEMEINKWKSKHGLT